MIGRWVRVNTLQSQQEQVSNGCTGSWIGLVASDYTLLQRRTAWRMWTGSHSHRQMLTAQQTLARSMPFSHTIGLQTSRPPLPLPALLQLTALNGTPPLSRCTLWYTGYMRQILLLEDFWKNGRGGRRVRGKMGKKRNEKKIDGKMKKREKWLVLIEFW